MSRQREVAQLGDLSVSFRRGCCALRALDVRGSDWNTGVLGNPAATRGADRDDDDDGDDNDETLSGKGMALQEHGRRDEVAGEGWERDPRAFRKADRRGKRAWKSGGRGPEGELRREREPKWRVDNKREETDAIRSKKHACNGHWKISL